MADARRKYDWRMIASIRAGVANGELKNREKRLWREDDFDPYAEQKPQAGIPLDKKGFGSLRRLLFGFG